MGNIFRCISSSHLTVTHYIRSFLGSLEKSFRITIEDSSDQRRSVQCRVLRWPPGWGSASRPGTWRGPAETVRRPQHRALAPVQDDDGDGGLHHARREATRTQATGSLSRGSVRSSPESSSHSLPSQVDWRSSSSVTA